MSNKFWIGYMLFFIFIFPMIFEYVPLLFDEDVGPGLLSSPWMAILYLGVGSLAWIVLIAAFYRFFVKPPQKKIKNMTNILTNGLPITAHIERKILDKEKKGRQVLELKISFKNLSNTLVQVPFVIYDSHPELRRYEVGEFIKMRVDPKLKAPVMLHEDLKLGKMTAMQGYLYCFFGLIAFSVLYLIFSYWLQNDGSGWRFLHFWHPWVTIPFWGLLLGWVLLLLPLGEPYGGLNTRAIKDAVLIFKGLFTKAEVLGADHTGLTVNDQPQIRYTIEYIDYSGEHHIVRFKKIVRLIELHQLGHDQVRILYDPDNPNNVGVAEEYLPKDNQDDL